MYVVYPVFHLFHVFASMFFMFLCFYVTEVFRPQFLGIPWISDPSESGGLPGRCSPPNKHIAALYRAIPNPRDLRLENSDEKRTSELQTRTKSNLFNFHIIIKPLNLIQYFSYEHGSGSGWRKALYWGRRLSKIICWILSNITFTPS